MSLIDRTFGLADDADSLGISCTESGVSLAGVPLLRKTVTGLAPRPVREIRSLLKAAFGDAIDPTGVVSGLNVVAEALNRGDLGRAMVAAIQLRLPQVTHGGALNITKAQGAINKYDPNEPRDERGRWTTGDDETGGAKRIPISSWIPPEPINDNIPKDIRDKFQETLSDWRIVNHMLTNICISNIQGGDYHDKVLDCVDANQKCEGLVKAGEKFLKRQDMCNWPDGTTAFARAGVLVPIRLGHKW